MDKRKFKRPYKHSRFASRKDYSQRKFLGAALVGMPDNLYSTSRILDQGDTATCTAQASVAIRESMMAGKQYDPWRQWDATLRFMGVDDASGADLKTALAVCVKTGFFEPGKADPSDRATAYFFVRKRLGEDWFDAVRNRIFLLYQKYGIVIPLSLGVNWYRDWDHAPEGIVPDSGKDLLGGHDIKIAGFVKKAGTDYVVIQNSWGEGFGEKGLFFASRAVFNKWFDVFGAGYIVDDPELEKTQYGFVAALLQNIVSLYQSLIQKLGKMVK